MTLLLLLGLTHGAAFFDLGVFPTPLALSIAVAKAVLIVLFFMHVCSRLTRLFVAAGFVWLGIMLLLAMSDYLSRGWVG